MEHRHGERVRTLALIRICQSDRKDRCWAGLLYNISQDGMFVVSERLPAINDSLDVYVQLAESYMNVCLPGQVVHANGHGFGMIFRQTNRQSERLIRLLLENRRVNEARQWIGSIGPSVGSDIAFFSSANQKAKESAP